MHALCLLVLVVYVLRLLAASDEVEVALGHEVRNRLAVAAKPSGAVLRLGPDPQADARCAAQVDAELCPTREGRPSRRKRTTGLKKETWTVARVASEREVVALPAGHYLRLPVTDHLRPSDERIDDFVDFVRRLSVGAHLHFHCHGGEGRTTSFMTLYDMLRNAASVSAASILARVRLLGGYCLCFIPPDAHRDYVLERWALFDRFYRYAREEGLAGRTWRDWSAPG